MKKTIKIITIGMAALSLAACGVKGEQPTETTQQNGNGQIEVSSNQTETKVEKA